MADPKWRLEGKWLEYCSCDSGCPCESMAPPTYGHCTGLVAFKGIRVNKVIENSPDNGLGRSGFLKQLFEFRYGHRFISRFERRRADDASLIEAIDQD